MRRCGRSAPAWTLGASIPVILMHEALRMDPHAWSRFAPELVGFARLGLVGLLVGEETVAETTEGLPALDVLPVRPPVNLGANQLAQCRRGRVELTEVCDHGAACADGCSVGDPGAHAMVLEFVANCHDSRVKEGPEFSSAGCDGSNRSRLARGYSCLGVEEEATQHCVRCLEALHVAREECVDLVVDLDGLHFSFPSFLGVLLSCRESMPDFLITQGGPQ